MSGYYLTEGKKEYYGEGRWIEINKRVDSFLRKYWSLLGLIFLLGLISIMAFREVGFLLMLFISVFVFIFRDYLSSHLPQDFHWEGPRNWIGWTKDGSWSTKKVSWVDRYVFTTIYVLTGTFFMWVVASAFGGFGFENSFTGTLYQLFILSSAVFIFTNIISPQKSLLEWIHPSLDNPSEILYDIKIGLQYAIIVLLAQLLISFIVFPQQISGPTFLVFITLVFLIPLVEAMWFIGCLLPSLVMPLGIIPGILITSGFTAAFHAFAFQQQPHLIFVTFFITVGFCLLTLRKMRFLPTAVSHISINFVAWLFLFFAITTLTNIQLIFAVILGAIAIIALRKL